MLKSISVKNYKSILDQPVNFECFNVIVGPNNHGKTNLLDAIDFLYNGTVSAFEKMLCQGGSGNDISVEAVFDNVEQFIPLAPRTQDAVIRQNLVDGKLTLRRTFSRGTEKPGYIEVVSPAGEVANHNGIDNAIKTLLPRLEYVRIKMQLDDATKILKTNYLGTMLYDIFTKITPEAETAFRAPLQNLDDYFNKPERRSGALTQLNTIEELIQTCLVGKFHDVQSVRLGVVLPKFDDFIKGFRVRINDGVEGEASEKGEGMQRGLMVSVIEAYSKYLREIISSETEDTRTETERTRAELKRRLPLLFVIDEAELHLHPSAQKDLKRALLTITEGGDQVILTTHSHILAKEIPNHSHIFRAEKNDQITSITQLAVTELFSLIYELLGTDPSDLLFPQNIGVVEGPSDDIFLTHCISLIQDNNTEKKEIIFHYGGGDSRAHTAAVSIDEMLKTAAYIPVYRNKLCVLLDNDVSTNVVDEIRNFLGDTDQARVVKLTKRGIEYYYPEIILRNICGLGDDSDLNSLITTYCHQANSNRDSRGTLGTFNGTKSELAQEVCRNFDDIELVDEEIRSWLAIVLEKSF